MDEELIIKKRKEFLDKMMVIHNAKQQDVEEFIKSLNSIQGVEVKEFKVKQIDESFRFIINLLHSINIILWTPIIIHFLNKKKSEGNKLISIEYKKIKIVQGDSKEVIERKVKIIFGFGKEAKEEKIKN